VSYTVGEVARLAGITVRTLHHYDEIGLLQPGGRSRAGYRLYDDPDLETLREILFYRELGFSLADIQRSVNDPDRDRLSNLCRQRDLLFAQLGRVEGLIGAIDAAIQSHETGVTMKPDDMFEVFGDFDPGEHTAEVEERWSGPRLEESRRRTSSYRKQDWETIKAESEGILRGFNAAKQASEAPESPVAMQLAEDHRLHIDRWFYPCSHEQHANLGMLYVTDDRFSKFWEKVEPGMAEYVRDAIEANAIAHLP